MEHIPHIENIFFNGWTGLVMMFILLGYMFSLGTSWHQYVKRLSSLGKQRMRMVNYADDVADWRADVALVLAVMMSIGMCVFSVIASAGWLEFSFLVYLIVVGVTLVLMILKYLLGKIVGWVFDLSVYIVDMKMRVVYCIAGVLCMITAMIISRCNVGSYSWVMFGIIVAACLIAEFVILVENFFGKVGALFYIFLYLCAAEILPLLVGFRIATQVLN